MYQKKLSVAKAKFRKMMRLQLVKDSGFSLSNNLLLLGRMKVSSMILLVLYAYLFYADFILLKETQNNGYRFTLAAIHSLGFFCSVIFLLFYKRIKKLPTKAMTIIINLYLFFYIFGGALASINSQRLNGNIDAYIIILISVAAIFPIRPLQFLAIAAINHILFMMGLVILGQSDPSSLIVKQINSNGTLVISCLISTLFYSYRINDFLNKNKLEASEKNLRHIFDVNPFPLVITSVQTGKVLMVNDKALEFYNVSKEDLHSIDATIFYQKKEERDAIVEQLYRLGSVENHVIEVITFDGVKKWILSNYKMIDYMDEKCLLTGVTDITDLKKLEGELTKHATIDTQTGVLNRRKGLEILQATLAQQIEFVLCFMDINDLKLVNDRYGHAEGDELIATVCGAATQNLTPHDIVFRFGGDEFVLLLLKQTPIRAEKIWTNIMRDIQQSNMKPYSISVSHGLFHYTPDQDITIESILEKADQEMYKEKAKMKMVPDTV